MSYMYIYFNSSRCIRVDIENEDTFDRLYEYMRQYDNNPSSVNKFITIENTAINVSTIDCIQLVNESDT
jgi:hypothetical protein